jgi:septal ring factor EnvC (AmiA/AmiB activator)
MDSHEIEDTSDWLGCPTPLDTCRHQLRMLENEVQELTLQIRQARQNIFKLVEMHTEAANERDTLRSQLAAAKAEAADANSLATEIETRSNWELMAKDKHISELTAKLRALTCQDQPVGLPGDR